MKLKILEDKWLLIEQARWKIEPLYRFSDPPVNVDPSLDPPEEEDHVHDVTDQGSQAQNDNVDQSLEPTEDQNNSQPPPPRAPHFLEIK